MSVDLQRRIKDDQEDVAVYVEDLVKWEDDIAQKDDELKRKAANAIPCFPPIRGTKESELPRVSEKEEKAMQEKELGNTAFKRGKLEVALRHYTKSLEYWPGSAVVYSNRAQLHLKQRDWQAANRDATTAIKLTCSGPREQCTADNVKAYFRRAVARGGLQLYNQAKADLEAILTFDPQHKEARAELRQVEEALRRLDEELEEKRGRKRLVVQEVDDEEEEEEEGRTMGKSNAPPGVGAAVEAPQRTPAASGPKKGRTVVIEEVDDEDDEVEDLPTAPPSAAGVPKQASPGPAAAAAPLAKSPPPATTTTAATASTPPKPPAQPPAPAPFRPKNAMELRRGAPMLIEEVEDDEEGGKDGTTAGEPPATAAPAPAVDHGPATVAAGPKRVVIQEVDDDEEEEEGAPAAAPPPPVVSTPPSAKPKAKPSVYEAPPAVKAEPRPPLEDTVAQRERERMAKPANPVDTVPTTFFEFEEAWRDLRRDDAQLSAFLLRIEPPAFKSLFRHSLSYDILVDVLRCLNSHLPTQPTEEAAYHALRVLYNLAQVPRFGELVMFMTNGEKAFVSSLFSKAAVSGMAADKVEKARERLAQFGL